MANKNLNKAKKAKNDEFYTQLSDIEKEMKHYREHFRGKVIYMNCDDPQESNFWKYFALNFDFFEIKKLISTHYDEEESTYKMTLDRDKKGKMNDYGQDEVGVPMGRIEPLKQNGDFRSDESIELLKEADVVVTNPPFSLFREYIAQLVEYEKKFITLGNQNALKYQEIFPLLKNGVIWTGNNYGSMAFEVPQDYDAKSVYTDIDNKKYQKLGNITWFTNLDYVRRNEDRILYKLYEGNEEKYPSYDNYPAIEVSKVKDIPGDYEGIMGVPITFLNNYNPNQFEILGMTDRQNTSGLRTKKYIKEDTPRFNDLNASCVIKTEDGYQSKYTRILIRNFKPETPEWKQ